MVHPKTTRFASFVLWMLALTIGVVFWGFLIAYAINGMMG